MVNDADATGATARFGSGACSALGAAPSGGATGEVAKARGAASSRPTGILLAGERVNDMEVCALSLPFRYRHYFQKIEQKHPKRHFYQENDLIVMIPVFCGKKMSKPFRLINTT